MPVWLLGRQGILALRYEEVTLLCWESQGSLHYLINITSIYDIIVHWCTGKKNSWNSCQNFHTHPRMKGLALPAAIAQPAHLERWHDGLGGEAPTAAMSRRHPSLKGHFGRDIFPSCGYYWSPTVGVSLKRKEGSIWPDGKDSFGHLDGRECSSQRIQSIKEAPEVL